MTNNSLPMVETQMLIRKPAAMVFQAFVDPAITKNFWFTKASSKLEVGKTITWTWEIYGVSTQILVKEMVQNEKIIIEWDEPATTVEFLFTALAEDRTYVIIRNYGFGSSGDALIAAIKDNTGGFTTVLDGLKAYLEHGINLNLIADKFPKDVTQHGK